MRFLVDAQLPPALARKLVELGQQADHVQDLGLEASSDRTIWKTATEQNNTGFEVEMSTDATNFTKLGFVKSKATTGNSNAPLIYDFNNEIPPTTIVYYRLRQTDKDGNGSYSKVVSINKENASQVHTILVYPNPPTDIVNVVCEKMSSISITDMTGRVITTQPVHESNKVQLKVNHLIPGIYLIKVTCTDNSIQSEKLIVNKK